MARLGGRPDAVPGAGGQPVGAAGPAAGTGAELAHRWPVVQPGAADHLRQARRPDRTAAAHHGRAVAAGTGRGARRGLPGAFLRLLSPRAPARREQFEELAVAYGELSYDSYRRLALAAGAPPVSPRGVVRAARAVGRSSRLAG